MRIYNIIGTIYNPQETTGGLAFNMSLGKDAGFCRIVWTWKAKFNFVLKDKQTVIIPSANMTLSNWTNKEGVTKTQLTIFTNYLEPFVSPYGSKTKEVEKPKQEYKESVDKTLQDFNSVNWDEELNDIKSTQPEETKKTEFKEILTYEQEVLLAKQEAARQDAIVKAAKEKIEEERKQSVLSKMDGE